MIKTKLLILTLCLWLPKAFCQEPPSQNGIRFEQNVRWAEVLKKARAERKFIFLDCFTTWCGPCKHMDSEVYEDEKVGTYFNKNFISVKVQMDRTKKDSQAIKDGYGDARLIAQTYTVDAYPSLFFFSPDGELVNKAVGYQDPEKFLQLGKQSTSPGFKYIDQNDVFDEKLRVFRSGPADYPKMLGLIASAIRIKKYKVADTLSREYLSYLRTLGFKRFCTKENLLFLEDKKIGTTDVLFDYIYRNPKSINGATGEPGFAERLVDRALARDYFDKLLVKGPEPDWAKLHQMIAAGYSAAYADRAVLSARTRWYEVNQDYANFTASLIRMVQGYGQKSVLVYSNMGVTRYMDQNLATDLLINAFAYEMVFKRSTDPAQVSICAEWMKGIAERAIKANDPSLGTDLVLDTYAGLLYRKGDSRKAIAYELMALEFAKAAKATNKEITGYEDTIAKMKAGTFSWMAGPKE